MRTSDAISLGDINDLIATFNDVGFRDHELFILLMLTGFASEILHPSIAQIAAIARRINSSQATPGTVPACHLVPQRS